MRANNPTLALGLGLALSMMGCGKPTPTLGSPTSAKETAISFVKPEKRSLVRIVEQPGSIQAFEETILYPKIPGYIQTLSLDPAKVNRPVHDRAFDLGSRVKANTVLAELSIPELDEELKQKEAMIRQSNAEVSQAQKALAVSEAAIVAAKAQVTETRASLTRAQALYDRWRSEMDRVNRLVNNGVIDSQTKDETQNQFKAAEATRSEVEAKVASSEAAVSKAVADREKSVADVVTSEARLDVSKAEVRKIIALLAYTRVKAPFDGVITRRTANTGDYVMADGKKGMFSIARIDPVRVIVNVPESEAGLIENDQSVRVTLSAIDSTPHVGKVVRTSWSLEPGSRTLRAEVDLPNPDGQLRPGMYVSTKLMIELPSGWSIPTSAIGKINDEPVMYLSEAGKAVRVTVQLHRGNELFTQIMKYRRPGESEWTPISGNEEIAGPATALSNDQNLSR